MRATLLAVLWLVVAQGAPAAAQGSKECLPSVCVAARDSDGGGCGRPGGQERAGVMLGVGVLGWPGPFVLEAYEYCRQSTAGMRSHGYAVRYDNAGLYDDPNHNVVWSKEDGSSNSTIAAWGTFLNTWPPILWYSKEVAVPASPPRLLLP